MNIRMGDSAVKHPTSCMYESVVQLAAGIGIIPIPCAAMLPPTALVKGTEGFDPMACNNIVDCG